MRDLKFDIAKGLGIIFVVIGHAFQVELRTMHPVAELFYVFHMPLFFIIGGLLFTPKDNIKNYTISRSISLLLPYATFLFLMILLPLLIGLGIGKLSFHEYLERTAKAIAGGQTAPMVFWFITCYWLANLLFAMLLNYSNKVCIAAVFALFAIGYLFAYIFPDVWFVLGLNVVPVALFCFWVGYYSKTYLRRLGLRSKIACILLSAFLLLCVWFGYIEHINMKYGDYGTFIISLGSAVIISFCVIFISEALTKIRLIAGSLSYIGNASMIIMYMHMGVMYLMLEIYHPSKFEMIVVSFFASLAVYIFVSKYNFTRLLMLGDLRFLPGFIRFHQT